MHTGQTPSILDAYGWDATFAERFAPFAEQELLPARVVVQYQSIYRVVTEDGELLATVTGKLRHRVAGRVDYPGVGDWVGIKLDQDSDRATIHGLVERKSRFVRKVSGSVVAEQVVAANVDVVLLVAGLDGDFNPRRLERYLVLANDSGARPVIVLTKADLVDSLDGPIQEARSVGGPSVPIHAVSAPYNEGYDVLASYLEPGKTVALLGSSGVGKSTIVNHLAGEYLQRTQEVRASDGKGRHTTTHRMLILLPSGGLLMDTPGMRELQLWDVDEGVEETFADIEKLATDWRFPDCQHEPEPGCAVLAAVADGRLASQRLTSYRKLLTELAQLTAKQERQNRLFEKRRKLGPKSAGKHAPRK